MEVNGRAGDRGRGRGGDRQRGRGGGFVLQNGWRGRFRQVVAGLGRSFGGMPGRMWGQTEGDDGVGIEVNGADGGAQSRCGGG